MARKGNGASERAISRHAALEREFDKCLEALAETKLAPGDVAAIDRHARCLTNLARAGKAIDGLEPTNPEDEAEMSDDDRGGEPDDPEELERAGAELQSRLDRLRATIEAKRLEGWTFTPRAAAGGEGDPAAP